MVIDSQALAFWMGVIVCLAFVIAWFLPFDHISDSEKAFDFLMVWMVIGWFPMGCVGLCIGFLLNFFTGETNFTTGSTLTGMASWIPVGFTVYKLHEKTL